MNQMDLKFEAAKDSLLAKEIVIENFSDQILRIELKLDELDPSSANNFYLTGNSHKECLAPFTDENEDNKCNGFGHSK